MEEIKVDEIGRLGYQQIGIAKLDKSSNHSLIYQLMDKAPAEAVAFWRLYEIQGKTGEVFVGYLKEGVTPGN